MANKRVEDISIKNRPSRMPEKKFVTRSENFCAFMVSLGYEIPKYTRPEHFDYIFQDSETARIARHMMTEIKPENIIDSKELALYEELKKDGKVLYGADLEAAFERHKALDIKRSRQDAANVTKRQELERQIEQRKAEISRMKQISSKLDAEIHSRETDDKVRESLAGFEKELCKKLDQDISASKKVLFDLTAQLREKLNQIHFKITAQGSSTKKVAEGKRITRLYQLDWMKVLEDEDKLLSLVKTMFQTYTADIQKQEDSGDIVNPLQAEVMFRMFQQHENQLERLKHLMIYEKVKEVEMDIQMAGFQAVVKNISSTVEEATQLSKVDGDIQSRMLRDIQSTNEGLEETLKREQTTLIETITYSEAERLTNEVREIFDLQSYAKKKLHDYYAFLVHILSHQRVRVDLARELIGVEKSKHERLTWVVENFRKKMANLSQMEEKFTNSEEFFFDPKLSSTFKECGIPPSMYQNPQSMYESVNLAAVRAERVELSKSIKDKNFTTNINSLTQKARMIQNQFENTKLKTLAKDPLDIAISELLEVQEQMQDKLSFQKKKNKERSTTEAVTESWNGLHKIQNALKMDFVRDNNGPLVNLTVTDH